MRHGASAGKDDAPVIEPERFIRENLPLTPVPHIPEIRLHLAQPSSRLSRLAVEGAEQRSPYWAFAWGGGLALARHILDHPDLVRGKTVLDIGSGSGLVAIAAKLAGAAEVTASRDRSASARRDSPKREANGVELTRPEPIRRRTRRRPSSISCSAGDVFYDKDVAIRMMAFLGACGAAGIGAW